MSSAATIRLPWSDEDKRLLIEYWSTLSSIVLISILLNRPEGSVQTEASRRNLPRRTEEKGRHRKKWTEKEEEELRSAIKIMRTTDGRIKIIDVANLTGRSIDAVASRILKDYNSKEEMRAALYIPNDIEEIKRLTARNKTPTKIITDSRKVRKIRICMSCESPFSSEGAHNRICPRCKSDNESNDYDY